MKIMHKYLANSKGRIVLTLIMLILFLGSGMFFLGNEMKQNRIYYLRNYESQQSHLVEQLSIKLASIIDEEQDTRKWISWLEKNQVSTSYVWQFIYQDDEPIYIKNTTTTTEAQEKDISLHQLIENAKVQKKQVVYKQFISRDATYTYGLILEESYILLSGRVNKHNEYVLLVIGLISIVFFIVTLFLVASYNRKDKELKELSNQLKRANLNVENLAVAKRKQLGEEGELSLENGHSNNYERELLDSFLNKSNQKELRPLGIIFIRLELANRYYAKKEIQELLEPVLECLTSKQFLFEISKGNFVILLYRSKEEQVIELIENIEVLWTFQLVEKGIKVHIASEWINNEHISAIEGFMKLEQKMKSGVNE